MLSVNPAADRGCNSRIHWECIVLYSYILQYVLSVNPAVDRRCNLGLYSFGLVIYYTYILSFNPAADRRCNSKVYSKIYRECIVLYSYDT